MNDPNKGLVDELRKEIEETRKQLAALQRDVARLNRAVQLKSGKITGVLVILAITRLLSYVILLIPAPIDYYGNTFLLLWYIEIVFWILLVCVWSSNNEMDKEISQRSRG